MKRIASTCFAFAAAACGPRADRPTTITNEPAPHEVRAPTPCPTGEELTELARRAWRKGAGNVMADCVAAWVGGETLWMIDGTFDPEPNEELRVGTWTALVTPNGEVRWAEGVDDHPHTILERVYDDGFRAIDLDGDGNDEILYVTHYSNHGFDDDTLTVLRFTDGRVEAVGQALVLSHDNSAGEAEPERIRTCNARHEIVDRRIAITYDGQCDLTGTVTYRYEAGRLIQE